MSFRALGVQGDRTSALYRNLTAVNIAKQELCEVTARILEIHYIDREKSILQVESWNLRREILRRVWREEIESPCEC